MKTGIETPEFWIGEWNASLERRAWPGGRGYAGRDLWNRMAAEYGKETATDSSRRRNTDALVSSLVAGGLLEPGFRVLDVGCGPGRTAIAFAERGAEVVALDFSEKMLERLRLSVPADLAGRVEPVEADWGEVDIETRGWKGAFDLVFASMTPGVQTPEAFLKLHRASRRACFFRGWAGRRTEPLFAELWRWIKGEPVPAMCGDISLAFNLLYAMGFSPSLEFNDIGWEKREPVEKASEFFTALFADVADLDGTELGDRIDRCLASFAEDGEVVRRTTGRTGTMTWRVG